MKIAYHFTIPPPPQPELDAAIQDALKLQSRFAGPLNYLYPARRATRLVPRFLCGLSQLPALARLNRTVALHQLYSNEFYFYPVLYALTKPIVYTVVTSLHGRGRPMFAPWLIKAVQVIVTSNPTDQQTLTEWGAQNVHVIPPGIDLSRFQPTPPPPMADDAFVLLCGSAPWSMAQFESKGLTLLFQALQARPQLRLILLWRGLFFAEVQQRITAAGLKGRVQVINRRVEVSQILQRVHVSVVLANSPYLIKAYPHSLLESLATGRPVIISAGIAMADFVQNHGCGEVVTPFALSSLLATLDRLRAQYATYQQQTAQLNMQPFSVQKLLQRYGEIYQQLSTV